MSRRKFIDIKWKMQGDQLPFVWQENNNPQYPFPGIFQVLRWEHRKEYDRLNQHIPSLVPQIPLDQAAYPEIRQWLQDQAIQLVFLSLVDSEKERLFCQKLLADFPNLRLFMELELDQIQSPPTLLAELKEHVQGLWINSNLDTGKSILPQLRPFFLQGLPGIAIKDPLISEISQLSEWKKYLEITELKLSILTNRVPALFLKNPNAHDRSLADQLLQQALLGKTHWAKINFFKEGQALKNVQAYLFYQDWRYSLFLINQGEEALELNFSHIFPQNPYGEQYYWVEKGEKLGLQRKYREQPDWVYFPAHSLSILSSQDFIGTRRSPDLPEVTSLEFHWDTETLKLNFEIDKNQEVTFKILDIQGDNYFNLGPKKLKKGPFELILDISRLQTGAYYLVIRINQKELVHPFLKDE
ncbi:MAG: hypothetical protein AAFU64_02320 [Bacteroidota bacterium]